MRRLLSLKCLANELLAVAVLFLLTMPAWACSDKTASVFDWQRCWSAARLVLLIPAFGLCWVFWFEFVFKQRLHHSNPNAPMPRSAFATSLAWCWASFWMIFLVLFAVVSDELLNPGINLFPANWLGGKLNYHWPWGVALIVNIISSFLLHWWQRSREATASRAA